MLAFALIPLGLYFGVLAVLENRRSPTVLSGRQDLVLLSGGLFGLLTCGPGRLLIPLPVLAHWGLGVWVFWIMFYFLAVYVATRFLNRRLVVYHCPIERLIPHLTELGERLDPGARLEGNVFHLPALGVQCALERGAYGGYVLLSATGPHQNRDGWSLFERELGGRCRGDRIAPGRMRVVWSALAFLTLLIAGCALAAHFSEIVNVYFDYWS